MRVRLTRAWLRAASLDHTGAHVARLAELAGLPSPVSARTARRLREVNVWHDGSGERDRRWVELDRGTVSVIVGLLDGTRHGIAAARMLFELLPRLGGALGAGKALVVPTRNLERRLGMSRPTVRRALIALAEAGLVTRRVWRYTTLRAAGLLLRDLKPRALSNAPHRRGRTRLTLRPKGRRYNAGREPRARRAPALTIADVCSIFAHLGVPAPSERGARRAAWRANKAGWSSRGLAALARGALPALLNPKTASPAGALGWLASSNRPPSDRPPPGHVEPWSAAPGLERAQRCGARLADWVGRGRRGSSQAVMRGFWMGRRREMLQCRALAMASVFGYIHAEMARALVTQNRAWDEVPTSKEHFCKLLSAPSA